VRLTRR